MYLPLFEHESFHSLRAFAGHVLTDFSAGHAEWFHLATHLLPCASADTTCCYYCISDVRTFDFTFELGDSTLLGPRRMPPSIPAPMGVLMESRGSKRFDPVFLL
jgi:hypothetical protein